MDVTHQGAGGPKPTMALCHVLLGQDRVKVRAFRQHHSRATWSSQTSKQGSNMGTTEFQQQPSNGQMVKAKALMDSRYSQIKILSLLSQW